MFINSLIEIGSKIIDKIFPDKTQAEQAKLKLIELQQQGALKEVEFDMQNVASARLREVEIAKAGKRDWVPPILAFFVTIGFFGLIMLLIRTDIDPDAKILLDVLLGSLGGAFLSIINYYFGSSASSRKKDDIIAELKKQI